MNAPYRDFPRIPDPVTMHSRLRLEALDQEIEQLRLVRMARAHNASARPRMTDLVRRFWRADRKQTVVEPA